MLTVKKGENRSGLGVALYFRRRRNWRFAQQKGSNEERKETQIEWLAEHALTSGEEKLNCLAGEERLKNKQKASGATRPRT